MRLFHWRKRQEEKTEVPQTVIPESMPEWQELDRYVEVDPHMIPVQVAIITAALSGQTTATLRIKHIYEQSEEAKLVAIAVASTVAQETTNQIIIRRIQRKVGTEHA